MSEPIVPSLTLNDGTELPQLGLGTYKLHGEDCERVIRAGIEAGYRHIDTASLYGNEEEVGKAIRDAIRAGDVEREELIVVTKLWNDQQGYDNVAPAFRESLTRLGLEYLDIYLLHWPWPQKGLFVESFEAMARIQGFGDVRSIGVCNFYEEVLDELIEKTGIVPVLNQVEMHLGFTQPELRRKHEELGIASEAWAPLARGVPLQDPDVKAIGAKHGVSEAEVLLRYLIQKGVSVIPKTASEQRVRDNWQALDFRLERKDMEILDGIEGREVYARLSNDPREFPG